MLVNNNNLTTIWFDKTEEVIKINFEHIEISKRRIIINHESLGN